MDSSESTDEDDGIPKINEGPKRTSYCNVCDGDVIDNLVSTHFALHRGQLGSRTFTCRKCFFVTGSKSNFESHLSTAHDWQEIIEEEDYPIQFGLDLDSSLKDRIEFDKTREMLNKKSKFCQISDFHMLRRLGCADSKQPLSDRSSYERFFSIYYQTQNLRAIWFCRVCKRTVKRSQLYSLRLAVLLHLDDHFCYDHTNIILDDQLSRAVKKEWKCLTKEIGSSVATFRQRHHVLSFSEYRSFSIYLTADPQMIEFFNQFMKTEVYDVCLICADLIYGQWRQHSTRHRKLKIKDSWSELYAVDRSDAPLEPPHSLLYMERVLKKSNRDEFDGMMFYRWCCRKPDCPKKSLESQCDFPVIWLARAYALFHLEHQHPQLFAEEFFDYEWKLVQYDSRIPSNVYDFRLQLPKLLIVDIGDPNLFALTSRFDILSMTYRGLYICSLCYYTDLSQGFINHITAEHGYCYDRIELCANPTHGAAIGDKNLPAKYSMIKIGDRIERSIIPPASVIGDIEHWNTFNERDGDPETIMKATADNKDLTQDEPVVDESDTEKVEKDQVITNEERKNGHTSIKPGSISGFCENSSSIIRRETIARILQEYVWKGSHPGALSTVTVSVLQTFWERHYCNICQASIKQGKGTWSSERMKEQSLLAHLITKHSDSEITEELRNHKLYALSNLRVNDEPQFLPFRLDSKGSLACSSCIPIPKTFSRLGALTSHWEACSITNGSLSLLYGGRRHRLSNVDSQTEASPSPAKEPEKKRRRSR